MNIEILISYFQVSLFVLTAGIVYLATCNRSRQRFCYIATRRTIRMNRIVYLVFYMMENWEGDLGNDLVGTDSSR